MVKSYIKDTNEFLKKPCSLPKLPDGIILCTMDAVELYPNIPHDEGLSALRKQLESHKEQFISTDTIIDLAEAVLKNNIFTFRKKRLEQKRWTAIGYKLAPTYSIFRPFQERHAIAHAHTHTLAKAFRSVINRTRKSNF